MPATHTSTRNNLSAVYQTDPTTTAPGQTPTTFGVTLQHLQLPISPTLCIHWRHSCPAQVLTARHDSARACIQDQHASRSTHAMRVQAACVSRSETNVPEAAQVSLSSMKLLVISPPCACPVPSHPTSSQLTIHQYVMALISGMNQTHVQQLQKEPGP